MVHADKAADAKNSRFAAFREKNLDQKNPSISLIVGQETTYTCPGLASSDFINERDD